MARIEAVICDFGGVLTSPMQDAFAAFQDASGVSLEALGEAIAAIAVKRGSNPLFDLETGRLGEAEFLSALGERLTEQLGRSSSWRTSASATSPTCAPTRR